MRTNSILALCAVLLFGVQSQAHALIFSKGTKVVGGSLTFPFEWRPSLQSSLSINAEPQAGIFFADGWLVSAGVKLKTPIFESRLPLGERWRWGLRASLIHYWDVDWAVKPFVGIQMAYEMRGIDFTTIEASLSVPAGVALPVSGSVMLELGVLASVNFVGLPKVVESVRIDPGYLGVKVLF